MKFFTFSLTFFRQLVLREGAFGTAGCLIPYFSKGFIVKLHSDVTTISTILLLVLEMSPNGANTLSKHGQKM